MQTPPSRQPLEERFFLWIPGRDGQKDWHGLRVTPVFEQPKREMQQDARLAGAWLSDHDQAPAWETTICRNYLVARPGQ